MATFTGVPTFTIDIDGVNANSTPVNFLYMTYGVAGRPSNVFFEAPRALQRSTLDLADRQITVYRNGIVMFKGRITDTDVSQSGTDYAPTFSAADVRFDLGGIVVGQYGNGEIDYGTDDPKGGWPGVGYTLSFNPGNRPNRSNAVYPSGAYGFTAPGAGQWWTWQNVLGLLFTHYIEPATLSYDPALLSTSQFYEKCTLGAIPKRSVAETLTLLMREMGGSWNVLYRGNVPVFVPVLADSSPPAMRPLICDDGQHSTALTQYTVSEYRVQKSIRRSFDRVEVHGGSNVIETYWTDNDADLNYALFNRVTVDAGGYLYFWGPDRAKYPLAFLEHYPSGSPLRLQWRRNLVTRADETTGAVLGAAASPETGVPLRAKDNIWLTVDGHTSYRRLAEGFEIDYDNMIVKMEYKVKVFSDETTATGKKPAREEIDLTAIDAANVGILFTVATEAAYEPVLGSQDSARYLETKRTRLVTMPRTDVEWRRYSVVHEPDSTNASSRTQIAETVVTGLQAYIDGRTEMLEKLNSVVATRQQAEYVFSATLPFCPIINIGDGITVGPLDLGLPSDMRVGSVSFDRTTMDTRITATSNIDGYV